MRKIVFIILCACFSKAGFAQTDTSKLYLRFPFVPPFRIITVPDSTVFTKDDLKKKKPTIIFIFSPDCEHCQHATKELTANTALFKKAQIVMSSPVEFSYLKKFYEEYKIADHANIIMGRDPTYYFGTFYHVRGFPRIFVYDKKGDFIKGFEGSVPMETIADVL
ncbi:MAG TPA: thioredoxin fold domain-containing protein [Ferruginibacter sp.]|nr:thioredoxin fold domain-containing protein [Ferruginibacter sp.]